MTDHQLFPDFDSFETTYEAGKPQLVWTRLVADLETPVSALIKISHDEPWSLLLESVVGGEIRGRYSIITLRPDLIWRCKDNQAEINLSADQGGTFTAQDGNALENLRQLVKANRMDIPAEIPAMSTGLYGYLGYDMVRQMEDLPDGNPDVLNLPDSILMRPTIVAVFDTVKDELFLVSPAHVRDGENAEQAYDAARQRLRRVVDDLESPVAISLKETVAPDTELPEPTSNTTRTEYHQMVNKAKEYIKAGDIFQVVPSQRFEMDFELPPLAFYRSLRRLNPSPFMFYLNLDGFSIIGASPEVLVRLRGDEVTMRPIAGTRTRGDTPEEDKAQEEDLLADKKELAEHLMLLDLGRNDVGRVSQIGTVKPTEEFIVERYSHVMHIVSNVTGQLDREKYDAIDALIAGFPAGTVSGAPKVRAMEIIDELEKSRRGVYAGSVGYFSASGDMDTCIALRTAVLKDNKLYIQAGGGVVYDSDPEAEYMETVNKSRAVVRAAQEAVRYAGGGAKSNATKL